MELRAAPAIMTEQEKIIVKKHMQEIGEPQVIEKWRFEDGTLLVCYGDRSYCYCPNGEIMGKGTYYYRREEGEWFDS